MAHARAGASSEAPYLWKWEPLLDGLLKASETIGIEQAERRAIRLVNPHMPIKSTSHTLQVTFSIVNPGEVARAHRHNMAAIRFVVQGKGAYTAVAGEKFYMEEGDLILTPNWTWHDHHNESEDPIIWLDGLDGPLIQSFNILFFEEYENSRTADYTWQPGNRSAVWVLPARQKEMKATGAGCRFRYAWKETHTALEPWATARRDPHDGTLVALHQSSNRRIIPIRLCLVKCSSSKARRSPKRTAIPARRFTMFARAGPHRGRRGLPRLEAREIVLWCRFGSGMRMRTLPMKKRCFSPSTIDR